MGRRLPEDLSLISSAHTGAGIESMITANWEDVTKRGVNDAASNVHDVGAVTLSITRQRVRSWTA